MRDESNKVCTINPKKTKKNIFTYLKSKIKNSSDEKCMQVLLLRKANICHVNVQTHLANRICFR